MNMAVYNGVVGGVSFVLNLCTLYILMKKNAARAATQKDTKQYFRQTEIGLCIISLGDFFFELIVMSFQVSLDFLIFTKLKVIILHPEIKPTINKHKV